MVLGVKKHAFFYNYNKSKPYFRFFLLISHHDYNRRDAD
jgi:hypothetical protein